LTKHDHDHDHHAHKAHAPAPRPAAAAPPVEEEKKTPLEEAQAKLQGLREKAETCPDADTTDLLHKQHYVVAEEEAKAKAEAAKGGKP